MILGYNLFSADLTACGRPINAAKTGIIRASESSSGFLLPEHRRFK